MERRVYREKQLVTEKDREGREGREGLFPFTSATLWRWVKAGHFPQPFKLGPGVTVWDADEVDAWLAARREAGAAPKSEGAHA